MSRHRLEWYDISTLILLFNLTSVVPKNYENDVCKIKDATAGRIKLFEVLMYLILIVSGPIEQFRLMVGVIQSNIGII